MCMAEAPFLATTSDRQVDRQPDRRTDGQTGRGDTPTCRRGRWDRQDRQDRGTQREKLQSSLSWDASISIAWLHCPHAWRTTCMQDASNQACAYTNIVQQTGFWVCETVTWEPQGGQWRVRLHSAHQERGNRWWAYLLLHACKVALLIFCSLPCSEAPDIYIYMCIYMCKFFLSYVWLRQVCCSLYASMQWAHDLVLCGLHKRQKSVCLSVCLSVSLSPFICMHGLVCVCMYIYNIYVIILVSWSIYLHHLWHPSSSR